MAGPWARAGDAQAAVCRPGGTGQLHQQLTQLTEHA
jgi:hypothetical protein